MYDYGYDYGYGYGMDYRMEPLLNMIGALISLISIVGVAFSVLMIISLWKIYKKAGKNGWEAIIPIYNIVVLLQIVELPMWYIALFFVPIANIYAMFKIYIELAHKFGKSTGFGVATVFFSVICLPILAFGKNNVYNGNNNSININNNIPNQTPQYTPNDNIVFQNQSNSMANNMNTSNNQETVMFNQNMNQDTNQMTPTQIFDNSVNNQINSVNTMPQSNVTTPDGFNQTTPITNQQPMNFQPQNSQINPQTSIATPNNVIEPPVQEVSQQPTFAYGTQNMEPTNQQQNVATNMNTTQQPFIPNQNNNPYNQNM